jgi:hypothetical protein
VAANPINFTDPLGLFRSPDYLRYTVPGQVLYDAGMTALENGSYGWAAADFVGMAAEQVLFVLTLGQSMTARGAATACEVGVSSTAAKGSQFVISGLTKAEARAAVQAMGLPNAQAMAVNSAISRATSTNVVTVTQYGPDVVVQIFRPGSTGYQVFESVVTPSGAKMVIQRAYDALGNLVHFHPGR